VGKSGLAEKSFAIPKQLVWEAYQRVKANKGAAGVDRQSIADFEVDLKNNLYKIWNRMSSGTYFPPPVMAVEIPKTGNGGGIRMLGVPTVADRVAQTVAALALQVRTESIFHPDSYGYRPRHSALDCQGTLVSAHRRPGILPADGHEFCPVVATELPGMSPVLR
jgi:RNA-directed DNA polymerase